MNSLQKLCKTIHGKKWNERVALCNAYIEKHKKNQPNVCRYLKYYFCLGSRSPVRTKYKNSKYFAHDVQVTYEIRVDGYSCSFCGKPMKEVSYRGTQPLGTPKKTCSEKCHIHKASIAGAKAITPEMRKEMIKKSQAAIYRRYGGKSALCDPKVRAKGKATLLQKYGCEFIMQNPSIKARAQATWKAKMNDPNAYKAVMAKRKATRQRHDPTWGTRKQEHGGRTKAGGKSKIYNILGRNIECQSATEAQFVKWLCLYKGYDLEDIVGQFDPDYNNFIYKEIKTFPDFYIKSKNIYIEIKSVYTFIGGMGNNATYVQSTLDANKRKAERSNSLNGITVRWVIKKERSKDFFIMPREWYYLSNKEILQLLKKNKVRIYN